MIRVKEISEFLFDIEKKYDLFSYKIDNVYIWKLLRFRIFNDIANQKKLFGDVNSKNYDRINNVEKAKYLIKHTYHFLFNNAANSFTKRDILVFQGARKKLVDGKYIEIYTDNIVKDLEEKKTNYQIVDIPDFKGKYLFNKDTKFATPDLLRKFITRKFINTTLKEKDVLFLEKTGGEINSYFDVKINMVSLTKLYLNIFKNNKAYYSKLFNRKAPKEIYLINSYGQEPLISAAQDLGIVVNELQHGVTTKYHMGYSFPHNNKVPYFPDKLLLFGEFWAETTKFPLQKENLLIYGYPYLINEMNKFSHLKRIKNQVLFITQPTINDRLKEEAYEFAKNNCEYMVVYKLHPNIQVSDIKDNDVLKIAEGLPNFKLIPHNKVNLYELMYTSQFQVGAYSTALFEGLYAGLKTVILDFPGIDHMEELINKGYAMLCKKEDNLKDVILSTRNTSVDGNYYYKN